MIAGEASGDALGGPLIRSMRALNPAIEVEGVGGPLMAAEGLASLVPMEELCVMGLSEVIGHLPRLLKLINGMVEEIEKRQPDIVITIDLPDFNFRVAERLKKRGTFKGKIYHYVAPTVWAWRPGRAKKIARYLDGLMCLFPFEPPYFEKEGLKAAYVGHPLIETDMTAIDTTAFLEEREIAPESFKVGLLFGSRKQELNKMKDVLLGAAELLCEQIPDTHFIVVTVPSLYLDVMNMMQETGLSFSVLDKPERKWTAFKACDAAMATSGTVGLELGYAGIPHAIGYKLNLASWVVAKMVIKTPYVHLVNILLKEPIVPELLQFRCTAENFARTLLHIRKKDGVADAQRESFARMSSHLKPEGIDNPSAAAARFVLED